VGPRPARDAAALVFTAFHYTFGHVIEGPALGPMIRAKTVCHNATTIEPVPEPLIVKDQHG
jgi:hypothetical protein